MTTHLGTSGFLFYRGKVLLGKRSADDPALPGQWCSPGGGVEPWETIDEALCREFIEEVGLRITPGRLIAVTQRIRSPERQVILVFKQVFTTPDLDPMTAQALEGFSEIGWFSYTDLQKPTHRGLITGMTWEALQELFKTGQ